MKIFGRMVDVHNREIYPSVVSVMNGKISKIERTPFDGGNFFLPGLIDSHIHIESSMITPGAFAVAAVRHGTTGVVSDPHEIANVLGLNGINYMIEDAEKVPLKFWFGASSCVPATSFETSGGVIDHKDIDTLLGSNKIKYLAEMMNFPGVIYDDDEVMKKLQTARRWNKPVDGHAPGLSGEMLKKYVSAGITTDHECSSYNEAKEKIGLGMKILIREGSAARNLNSLKELFRTDPENVMLCSDDLHPEMLKERHINKLIAKLISEGYDCYDVIRSATINPVKHYNLEAGLLRVGDSADLIVVDDLEHMNVIETWLAGEKIFSEGETRFEYLPGKAVNNFKCSHINAGQIYVRNNNGPLRVIQAMDEELLTGVYRWQPPAGAIDVSTDLSSDILKIVVKDRYKDSPPATGFIKGFGLSRGAFASSIAHDNHNIICIGTNDADIVSAVNRIVDMEGGLAVCEEGKISSIELNIAGIMTTKSCDEVAHIYQQLSETVKSNGCIMKAPFMTLSFMALLVIPELKIGDRGLFDVTKFMPVSVYM